MLDASQGSGLTTACLGEIAEINPRLRTKPAYNDTIAFVPMSALSSIDGRIVGAETRPYADVAKGYTPFQNGDLLIAKITPCFENNKIGQANIAFELGFGSTEFHIVRPHAEKADSRYLTHFLRQESIRQAGQRIMTGSAGQRRVPENFVKDLLVPLPPLSEQRRIAAILDQADALQAKRRAALAQFDEMAQAIFVEMFGDLRSTTTRQVPIARYVSRFESGKSIEGVDENHSPGFRVLKVSAVTSGTYLPNESKPLPVRYIPPTDHIVKDGDLLFSRANTTNLIGAVAYVYNTPVNLALSDKIWRFVWREPQQIVPLFIKTLFQMPTMREEIARRATGTSGSMKNISQQKLLSIPTIFPEVALQRRFEERLQTARSVSQSAMASAEHLDSLFASLQHRAFTGAL